MWKKNDTASSSSAKTRSIEASRPAGASTPAPFASRSEWVAIGPTLTVKGEITGDEDLVIEGSVEGRIAIRRHRVTVGEHGRVEADIEAESIRVAGEVRGNLTGTEEVVLLATGRLEGDIKAGNVTLENGARFKGSIDMESKPKSSDASASKEGSTAQGAKPNGASASDPVAPRPVTVTGHRP